jgi:hypothetical protein
LSKKSGRYVLPADNGKYFNHSDAPNTRSHYTDGEDEVVTRATQDIRAGEELTDDYSSFEAFDDGNNVLDEMIGRYNLVDEGDPRLKPTGAYAGQEHGEPTNRLSGMSAACDSRCSYANTQSCS